MKSAEYVLKKKMSYENLFLHLIHYERLKKILLSEEQSANIGNLLKVEPDEFKNISTTDKNVENINVLNFTKNENPEKHLKRFPN